MVLGRNIDVDDIFDVQASLLRLLLLIGKLTFDPASKLAWKRNKEEYQNAEYNYISRKQFLICASQRRTATHVPCTDRAVLHGWTLITDYINSLVKGPHVAWTPSQCLKALLLLSGHSLKNNYCP